MLYQVFFLRQGKQSVIISNKHGICKLPRDLPNDLRLRIFENLLMPSLKINHALRFDHLLTSGSGPTSLFQHINTSTTTKSC